MAKIRLVEEENKAEYKVGNAVLSENEIIKTAREILRKRNETLNSTKFTNSSLVKSFLVDQMLGLEREEFHVMYLTTQHQLIKSECVFQGTINAAAVYPREIVKRALELNAAAVIIAHNHPSGETTPSQADIRVTERIKQALNTVDIQLLDHIIVGGMETLSFAETHRL